MASWDHEGIIELFRRVPRLAAALLRGPLGVTLPAFSEARVEPGTMAELKPAQAHADLLRNRGRYRHGSKHCRPPRLGTARCNDWVGRRTVQL